MTGSVAVMGTGIMGTGMARSLVRAGLDVTVWNRSADKARPLADDGAKVAADAAEAVTGADVVVTMLFDADAVAEVMQRALAATPEHAVWVQTSTVGLAGTQRLAELADRYGRGYLDAPVLGTKRPAEQGELIVLASGPRALEPQVAPVFEAIGSKTVWVGERIGDGHRLKLALNSWVLSITAATGQAIALARGLGVDPQLFLDTIAGGGTDSPYAQVKGRTMIAGEFPPAFSLAGAAKDAELIVDALREAGDDPSLMQAVHRLMSTAAAAGHADEDMAAVVYAFR
ncbi:MAG: 3-hydroxyisobutyrate dehydrogenase [Pseudonocardiales bacterium]|nr:MAG: 3-hydroxyisobutyrate dehydrogenase [Pseudonocardiales bacterium]